MRISKIKILSFLLLIVFTIPILVMGIHDNFEHDHSHSLSQNSNSSINKIDKSLCLIHNFKYYLFDNLKAEILTEIIPIQNGFTPQIVNLFIKENIISFYLLRGPPSV